MKPYEGRRELSCIHDHHQPARLCTSCSKSDWFLEDMRQATELGLTIVGVADEGDITKTPPTRPLGERK